MRPSNAWSGWGISQVFLKFRIKIAKYFQLMPQLPRLLALLFTATCLILVLITLFAGLRAVEEHRNYDLASAGYERVRQAENLVNALLEAESSQRAMLVTLDNVYDVEYEGHRQAIDELVSIFRDESASDSVNVDDAQEFLALIAQRIAMMDNIAQFLDSQKLDEATASVRTYEGKIVMDAISAVAARLNSAEQEQLEARRLLASDHANQQIWLLAAGALLSVLIMSGAYLGISRSIQKNDALIAQINRNSYDITHINQLSSSLQSCNSLQESVPVLQHYLLLLFPRSSGGVYLLRSSRNLLQLSATWGDNVAGLPDPIEPGACWGLRMGRTHIMADRQSDMPCEHHTAETPSICIPLQAQSDIVGLLTLQIPELRKLNESKVRAELVATHCSAALASIVLREALQQQSIRDPLTGLYNRRYMETTLDRELSRMQRSKNVLSAIMFDIDHFKAFNDGFGHPAGDLVLKEFGELLRKFVRAEDIACRFGGEEFLVVMPASDALEAARRAEEIRQQLANLSLNFHGQPLPKVHASAGVAVFPEHATDKETLIHCADTALYSAKKQGRDRVVVSG